MTGGFSAPIPASEDKAKELTDMPVWITAIGSSTAASAIVSQGLDFCGFSAVEAAKQAYRKAVQTLINQSNTLMWHMCTIASQ